MHVLSIILMALYSIGLIAIFVYTVVQVHLVYHYLKAKNKQENYRQNWTDKPESAYPNVTVQLPVYNERYVIARLMNAVARFEWPKDKLEIQVLDDSTDETSQIIAEKVSELQRRGLNIRHMQRDSREGYKAGALQHGLHQASGEFIAIFDADFVPEPDFLMETMPAFEDKKIGLVQTRWGHLNQNYSLLTKVQAFALNGHFTVEQKGRNKAGYFMNFNGTAGVWRKATIKDAGGWHYDTLTEDLDLSYRAQIKGWKFQYIEDVVAPAELPVAISALKTQQFRWTKGAAESARKHLATIWRGDFPLIKKIQASSHLLSSSVFIFILLISVLSVPLLWVENTQPELAGFFKWAGFFLIGLFGWMLFYGASFQKEEGTIWKKIKRMSVEFPLFLSLSMGLSLHNSIAVIKGLFGKATPFIRTPKFNITRLSDSWNDNKYLLKKMDISVIFEGVLALYFLSAIIAAFATKNFGMLLFHLLLFFGFSTIFGYSVYEKLIKPV